MEIETKESYNYTPICIITTHKTSAYLPFIYFLSKCHHFDTNKSNFHHAENKVRTDKALVCKMLFLNDILNI